MLLNNIGYTIINILYGELEMKKNCWEVKSCDRYSKRLGESTCPVCKEARLDGVHGGVNGGRACWTVAHTRCGGTEQGSFAKKFNNCKECDFYNMVKEEELGKFQLSATIMSKLKE